MTKTTNYHLPQWEAADPVRREDFNAAFAALDRTGGVMQDLTGRAAQMDTVLQNLSYDLYHIMVRAIYEGKQTGAQKGIWLNTLDAAEDVEGRDGAVWNESGTLTVGAGTGMTLAQLNETIEMNNPVHTIYSLNTSSCSKASFRACGYAAVTRITLYIQTLNDYTSNAFTTNIRLYNADTETLLYTSGDVTMPSANGIKSKAVTVDNWQLEAEVNYRLETDLPENVNLNGCYGFSASTGGTLTAAITPQCSLSGQLTKTVTLDGSAAHLTGLIRYSGSTPQLRANGAPLTLAATRQAVTADGTDCNEVEYVMDGLFAEAVTLQLNMAVDTETEQCVVYDYGLIML